MHTYQALQAAVPATRQNVQLDNSKSMSVTPHAAGKFDLTLLGEANHSSHFYYCSQQPPRCAVSQYLLTLALIMTSVSVWNALSDKSRIADRFHHF
jgi:hypothetical protein